MVRLTRPVLYILFLVSCPCYAQFLKFTDTFDDNRFNWYQGEANGGAEHIRDGKLNISAENGWITTIKPYVNYEKDFTLQATVRQISGANTGVGIAWGCHWKNSDRNYLVVSGNGYYYVANGKEEMKTKIPGINEWVNSKSVKFLGETNVLRVEQRSGNLSLYINDDKVFTTKAFRWPGTEIGVIAFGQLSFETDNFSFDQGGGAINLPPALTKGLIKENLGANVNTPIDDLSPQISADGKTLYFGREYYEGNMGGTTDVEDFYVSHFDGAQWSKAENMGSPINSISTDNILAISTDNNSVLYATGSKFRIRKRTQTGWSEPEDLGISFVNEGTNFESYLSSDGKAVLFTARNSGNLSYIDNGLLERDIFVSVQDATGKWSANINLGPEINSPGDELGPFLAADGRTLYFATTGRAGYGSYDLFVSKRIGDGWTHWSEPVNLGPEINTTVFDAYYVLPASGDYAYMVSDQKSYGKADIVRIKQAKETKPAPVVLVRGKTLDAKTKTPISADIHIDNLGTRAEVGEAISDPANGDFKFVLPFGVSYGFHASAPGHLSVNENLELLTLSTYSEIEKNLYLVPIEVGANIQLNNVFFEQGRPILKPESFPELDRLVSIMNENPSLEIELHGYTDSNGRETSLIILSMDRVNAVKRYMVDKGIAAKRIAGKGFGPANPVVKNDTEEHRRMNRRVEFKVVKK